MSSHILKIDGQEWKRDSNQPFSEGVLYIKREKNGKIKRRLLKIDEALKLERETKQLKSKKLI